MIPTIAFFNNKGGVGKTVDLDPQANLTAAMVEEERLEELWTPGGPATIYGSIAPLMSGTGDVLPPHRERIANNLELVVGDLTISRFEDELASQWARCLDRQERAFRVISAFHRCIQRAAEEMAAEVVVIDLGPNLGAINRAALVACRHIVMPVAPDLFSLQGLRNLGPTVRQWRGEWDERIPRNPVPTLGLSGDTMNAAGYVVLQHSIRLDRPMHAYDLWMNRIPEVYATYVLDKTPATTQPSSDPHCLGLLKRYGSLMPMAQEARKPIFHLRLRWRAGRTRDRRSRCAQGLREGCGPDRACHVASGQEAARPCATVNDLSSRPRQPCCVCMQFAAGDRGGGPGQAGAAGARRRGHL
ncbi:MAG TPA: ParA family protein [Kofleriaceae bacterium]|nr:ParA family protein [Kofleriaceae bacterium]